MSESGNMDMEDRVVGRHLTAAVPAYKEGDVVETRSHPDPILVEDKALIRGKPGFIGRDTRTGEMVKVLDVDVRRVRRKELSDYIPSHDMPERPAIAVQEILNARIDGRTVHEEIRKFLQTVVGRGQDVHKLIGKAWDKYQTSVVQEQEPLNRRDLEQAVLRTVIKDFGSDPLAKALAHAISTGDWIY